MSESISVKYQKVVSSYTNSKPVVRFIVRGVMLYALWAVFYKIFRYSFMVNSIYEYVTLYFTNSLLYSSQFMLNLFGFESEVIIEQKVLILSGTNGILLNRGCLGRNLMGLFVGFLIAYPGSVKTKFWYIPLGIVLIFFINIMRISGLSLSMLYFPKGYMIYNHHDIFKYAVYFLIFIMWTIWINKFSKKKQNPLSQEFEKQNEYVELLHFKKVSRITR